MKVALKFITLLLVIVCVSTLKTKCPFTFLYHFGDGISDMGNSVRVLPFGPNLPSTRFPYGLTYPGTPTGRWSDGRVDVDYVAQRVGLPRIKPYLELDMNSSRSYDYDGVIFSVEGSTVLNTSFFNSSGIQVPPYNIPLAEQLFWFTSYLQTICTNQTECERMKLPNSVVLFENGELNDIGYALVQGRSIQEVRGFVPLMVQALVDAGREVARMGATRIIYTTAAPLGCYPYILTALSSDDPTAYDALGCLKAVNALALSFNTKLQLALTALKLEFPAVTILPADFYTAAKTVILQKSTLGVDGINPALKSCCGTGGRYNYDSQRFCGSPNVTVCPNPNNTVYWDGLHFTQESYRRVISILAPPALLLLNCITI